METSCPQSWPVSHGGINGKTCPQWKPCRAQIHVIQTKIVTLRRSSYAEAKRMWRFSLETIVPNLWLSGSATRNPYSSCDHDRISIHWGSMPSQGFIGWCCSVFPCVVSMHWMLQKSSMSLSNRRRTDLDILVSTPANYTTLDQFNRDSRWFHHNIVSFEWTSR